MIIVVVDECLKVANLDLFLATLAFKKRVELELWIGTVLVHRVLPPILVVHEARMRLKKPLYDLIGFEFIVSNTEDFEGLLPGDKTTLNSQTLLSHLLAALVAELFHRRFRTLLMNVLKDLFTPFFSSKRANHVWLLLFLVQVHKVRSHVVHVHVG